MLQTCQAADQAAAQLKTLAERARDMQKDQDMLRDPDQQRDMDQLRLHLNAVADQTRGQRADDGADAEAHERTAGSVRRRTPSLALGTHRAVYSPAVVGRPAAAGTLTRRRFRIGPDAFAFPDLEL